MPVYIVKVERHAHAEWTVRAPDRETAKQLADELGTMDDYAYNTSVIMEADDDGQAVDAGTED